MKIIAITAIFAFVLSSCSIDSVVYTNEKIEKSNILEFSSFVEFNSDISELLNSGVSTRSSISKFSGFTSFLDEIPDINSFNSKDEFEEYILLNSGAFAENEFKSSDGETKTLYTLAMNPVLAAAINEDGNIKVQDHVYNLLNESERDDFLEKCSSNENASTSRFITDIADWSTIAIPMWHGATSWPTYSVTDFTAIIGGRTTIVQLWKGYCPTIALVGGVGAEIGLYQTPPCWAPAFWWPDYTHTVNISYDLKYNGDNSSYIQKSGNTWWLNGWRGYESSPSSWGADYTLHYTIDGVSRTW